MLENDKFTKLVKDMQESFTYIPTVPNIIVILHGYSVICYINLIYIILYTQQ